MGGASAVVAQHRLHRFAVLAAELFPLYLGQPAAQHNAAVVVEHVAVIELRIRVVVEIGGDAGDDGLLAPQIHLSAFSGGVDVDLDAFLIADRTVTERHGIRQAVLIRRGHDHEGRRIQDGGDDVLFLDLVLELAHFDFS